MDFDRIDGGEVKEDGITNDKKMEFDKIGGGSKWDGNLYV